MAFQAEIEKLARTRRAYLRFALAENRPDRLWTGSVDRRYGKVGDAQGTVPVMATVSRFGTIQRSLANFLYSLEVPNVSIELFDPNREWHALAGGTDDQITYRNLSLWLRVLDDVLNPYDQRVAVAQIRKPSFPSGGKVTLDCQVASGNFLGAKVPRRFITTEDFPNAPVESQGLPVPIIYGVRSNKVNAMTPSGGTTSGGGSTDSDSDGGEPVFGDIINCSDLWLDNFETGTLAPYGANAANFALVSGVGVLNTTAVRSLVAGAELVVTVTPPRRTFCVEWSSDHDQPVADVISQYTVTGLNLYMYEGSHVSIDGPTGRLALIDNAIIPGTRQSFKIEGAFATKTAAVRNKDGYLKFYVNGVVRYELLNTDLVYTAADTGMWGRVAMMPNGDGDEFHIGSGLTPPVDEDNAPAPAKPSCKPEESSPTPSGAAIKAILVGGYKGPPSKDTSPAPTGPCGREPWGTAAKLAAALQEAKDDGTLMENDHFVDCIGRGDLSVINELETVPTTKSELARLIGHGDLNCLLYGDCGSGTRAKAASVDNVYVLAGHALKEVTAVYVLKTVQVKKTTTDSDGDETETTEKSEPVQVKMTKGKDYRTEIRDINGHRYHVLVFTKPQVSDTCEYYEVTANVKGIETNGNGTGTLLTNADDIFEHAMLNWILNSYQSSVGPFAPPGGPWFTDVPYAPGIWDHESVVAAKAVAAARVAGGYKGAGTLDEVIEAREWIREMLVSFNLELYFNNNLGASGAWSVCRFDPNMSRASLPHWDAGVDAILRDSFGIDVAVEQMVNVLPFFGGPTTQRMDAKSGVPSATSGGGWRVSGQARSSASIDRYGMAIAEPLYLKWSDDANTIGSVMSAYLRYQDLPPVTATFRMGLRALTSPLGSLIRLTHPDGIGSTTGWTEQVCKVTRSDIDLDRLVANVTVLSVDRLMKGTWMTGIEMHPSPNHGPRRKRVSAIVLHYTGSLGLDGVLDWYSRKDSGMSVHYVIGREGRTVQMVEESEAAWHAGRSAMYPREKPPRETNVNDFSIGIELVGTADSGFTDRQLAALYALLERLVATYGILPNRVVGHAHIAPGRKLDPDGFDRQFPWPKVRMVCQVALTASRVSVQEG